MVYPAGTGLINRWIRGSPEPVFMKKIQVRVRVRDLNDVPNRYRIDNRKGGEEKIW